MKDYENSKLFCIVRNNLKAYLDGVINDSVAVISLEEYNSIKETEYIMKSPAMMDIIRKGEREIRNGGGKPSMSMSYGTGTARI